MTDQQHPITPPPELVQQWETDWHTSDNTDGNRFSHFLATRAAQWGADQELEACCEWLKADVYPDIAIDLSDARRPKPQSLAEEALAAVTAIKNMADDYKQFDQDVDIIHRALERLQELEGQSND